MPAIARLREIHLGTWYELHDTLHFVLAVLDGAQVHETQGLKLLHLFGEFAQIVAPEVEGEQLCEVADAGW
jgi:hypothetical protein